jgi:hypothetical protein
MKTKIHLPFLALALLSMLIAPFSAWSQGTAFSYQGRLTEGGNAPSGLYDLRFILYSTDPGGSQVGPILTNSPTAVNGGLFTVTLDFGPNIFTNASQFLEIAVRTNGAGGFTILGPRQRLTPTPYAVYAETVGSGGLAPGTYGNTVAFNNAANSFSGAFTGNGAGLTSVNAATLSGLNSSSFWKLGGNAGANPTNGNYIGTTDNLPLEFKVNGFRAIRLERINEVNRSNLVNVINGSSVNFVVNGVAGAVIAGGGALDYYGPFATNSVTGDLGTVGGGRGNTSGASATVGGGEVNTASGISSTVGGGVANRASGTTSTIAGGDNNTASGAWSTVAGGYLNTATAPHSFAAGNRAKANHKGAFVWGDSEIADFSSTGEDQFLIRSAGGVGINANNPQAPLHVMGGGDAGLASGGNIISGSVNGQNIVIDNNEIISRNNGATSDLILNSSGGNVGIGRSPTANALEIAGNASKSAAGSWLANSDARIKTDVRTVTNALEKLSQVRLVQFRYTDTYRAAHPGVEERKYLNVVAQEFCKVFPDDVKSSGEKLPNGDDILQVDTYPLTIYSAAAIQELNRKLNDKEARVSALEQELSELKRLIKKLSDKRD